MTDDLDRIVGRRLRRRRHTLEMTQTEVADAMGVRFQQVQKYECAANRLSLSRFIQFCEALGVQPAQVLDGLVRENAQCPS